jgi:hypothetical protein
LSFVHFDEGDVVRHHLVQRIVRAYDEHKTRVAEQQMLLLAEPKIAETKIVETKNVEPRNIEASEKPSTAAAHEEKVASADAKG